MLSKLFIQQAHFISVTWNNNFLYGLYMQKKKKKVNEIQLGC